jgi:hypothetical protein
VTEAGIALASGARRFKKQIRLTFAAPTDEHQRYSVTAAFSMSTNVPLSP